MTITEFLLARIAEDEGAYRAEATGIEWLSVGGRNLWDHLRAECEAKWELVLELSRMENEEMGWDGIEGKVMRYLAHPYADHPDFDPEWSVRG